MSQCLLTPVAPHAGATLATINAAQDDAALRAQPDSLEPTPTPHPNSQGGAPLQVKTDLAGHAGDAASGAKVAAEADKVSPLLDPHPSPLLLSLSPPRPLASSHR